MNGPRFFVLTAGDTPTSAIDLVESRGHVVVGSRLTTGCSTVTYGICEVSEPKALRFLAFARTQATFTGTDIVRFGLGKSWVDNWGEAEDWTTETRRGKTVRVRTYKLTTKEEKLPDWGYRDVAAEMLAADAARKAEVA